MVDCETFKGSICQRPYVSAGWLRASSSVNEHIITYFCNLQPHNAIEDGPYNHGFVWFLKPLDYNSYVTDQILEGSAVAVAKSQFPPNGRKT